jgi:hypothetical protein
MTASKLNVVGMPGATTLAIAEPVAVAKSRSLALALRFGITGVAVASAVVGWLLFGDADPALWSNGWRDVDLRTAGRAGPVVCRALVGHDDGAGRIP